MESMKLSLTFLILSFLVVGCVETVVDEPDVIVVEEEDPEVVVVDEIIEEPEVVVDPEVPDGIELDDVPKPDDTLDINRELCAENGGNWNECGSPCAGTAAEVCIQICNPQCECGGIAGFACPDGFKCRLTGKIADEMGVCI